MSLVHERITGAHSSPLITRGVVARPLHLSVPESEPWAVDQSHTVSLVQPGESVVEMKCQH